MSAVFDYISYWMPGFFLDLNRSSSHWLINYLQLVVNAIQLIYVIVAILSNPR
jgi:hypothetical protein